jgi:hypothetical protein
MTPTLAEFLLARIAEDEAKARDAFYDGQMWVPEEEAVVAADRDLDRVFFLDRKRDAVHAANWSPGRVLAECEAKRRIVEEYAEAIAPDPNPYHGSNTGTPSDDGFYEGGWEDALKLACQCLALPYAGHPDYREEWRV